MVRAFVREELKDKELSLLTKNHIVLAIDEICANLIVHSNHSDENQSIKLKMELRSSPRGIAFELIEKGTPFDYSSYKEPKIEDLKQNQSKGQMGMVLVRRIMDKIEYIHQDDQNICRLFKSLA